MAPSLLPSPEKSMCFPQSFVVDTASLSRTVILSPPLVVATRRCWPPSEPKCHHFTSSWHNQLETFSEFRIYGFCYSNFGKHVYDRKLQIVSISTRDQIKSLGPAGSKLQCLEVTLRQI
ncbi:hypothetical protein PIB30_082473 [Stylosanthes scabra]|uniref:Uncharacterized protein n=1 Tax=Stylosanthes scabra TaxID=79078 RepID=A0ABU6VQH1_9FABA|nr:hypothetical protein [Stylosanthes scabra]